ncbi:MAG: hypothetical protein NZ870_02055 [bacterium]|nr:hypothetical protein [bacterium]
MLIFLMGIYLFAHSDCCSVDAKETKVKSEGKVIEMTMLKCDCGFEASNKRELKKHMFNEHPEKALKCRKCDIEFKTKAELKEHFKKHHFKKDH